MSTARRPPIFIVGSARSGTSLLRLVLDSHPEIACGPETHFLARMDDDQRRFGHQLARYGFQDSYWVAKYREFFESFKVEYMERKHKRRWADKTPNYAQHLPFITTLFPEAQVIHVIRDARMVTASSLARWGWRRAWNAPQAWVDSVSAARAFGATMPSTKYREVRFEAIVGDTEETLRSVFAWLGEEWDPRVLDYDQFEHDDSGRNQTVSAAGRRSGSGAIDSNRASRPSRELDPILRAKAEHIAGRLNRDLGYR